MASDDYAARIAKLQDALLEGRIDQATYDKLKQDLIAPKPESRTQQPPQPPLKSPPSTGQALPAHRVRNEGRPVNQVPPLAALAPPTKPSQSSSSQGNKPKQAASAGPAPVTVAAKIARPKPTASTVEAVPSNIRTAGFLWVGVGVLTLAHFLISCLVFGLSTTSHRNPAGDAFCVGIICVFLGGFFFLIGLQSIRGKVKDPFNNSIGSIAFGIIALIGGVLAAIAGQTLLAALGFVTAIALVVAGVLALSGRPKLGSLSLPKSLVSPTYIYVIIGSLIALAVLICILVGSGKSGWEVLQGLLGCGFGLGLLIAILGSLVAAVEHMGCVRRSRNAVKETTSRIQESKGLSQAAIADLYYTRADQYSTLAVFLHWERERANAIKAIEEGIHDCETALKLDPTLASKSAFISFYEKLREELREKQSRVEVEQRKHRIAYYILGAVAVLAFFTNPNEDNFRRAFVDRFAATDNDHELVKAAKRLGANTFLEQCLVIKYQNYFFFSICDVHVKGLDVVIAEPEKRYVGVFGSWHQISSK